MQIVINENSYSVPTAWNEIPLGRFMDYMAQYEEEATADRKQLVLVSTLTGAPKPLLEKAKKNVIDQAVEELNKIMSREASKQLNLIIEIDGIEYGFHPNLHELRLKEFVDLDNKLSSGWEAMHEVMAILYRPVTKKKGDKYRIEEYDFKTAKKRAEMFKEELSVDTVNGAAAFFLNIAVGYLNITQQFLDKMNRKQRRKAIRQMRNNLTKNTGGME
jgi:hypothetical protein